MNNKNELEIFNGCFDLDVFECNESLAKKVFAQKSDELLNTGKTILEKIIAASPVIAELAKKLEKTEKLKLSFSDEVLQKLKDGTYRLMKEKDSGIFKAVAVGPGGIKELGNISIEQIPREIDLTQLSNAMQGMAINEKLQEISEKLEEMSKTIEGVIRGQHNDRLAMYYSGESLYREALVCIDKNMRIQLEASAIKALSDSVAALKVTLMSDIKELCEHFDFEKQRFDKKIKVEKIHEKVELINSAFSAIHDSTALKSAIYYKEGEYGAVTVTLSEYKRFLQETLDDERANILYFADENEKKYLSGVWDMRKNHLPEEIEEVKNRLSSPKEFFIEGEINDE